MSTCVECGREEFSRYFTAAQLSAIHLAAVALQSSEHRTRSAVVELVKIDEKDGAEVLERDANLKLDALQILMTMLGVTTLQKEMPTGAPMSDLVHRGAPAQTTLPPVPRGSVRPEDCAHPNRNMNGGCDDCGDPCL